MAAWVSLLKQNGGTKTIMKRMVMLYLHDTVKLAFVQRSKNLHQRGKSLWHDSSLLRSRFQSRHVMLLEECCLTTMITAAKDDSGQYEIMDW